MATPTSNSIGVTFFDPALLGLGRYVADGEKWGGALHTGVTLTYSFPTGIAYHDPNYPGNEWNSWFALDSLERSAVVTALGTWSRFANVSFVQSGDNSTTVGELRFAYSNTLDSGEAAHAYLPWTDPAAGDVWFSSANFNKDGGGIPLGSYDFLTILHEVGHALGLKHPFELPNAIPAAQDNYFYSIMSYTASPYSLHGDNFASFYPTTPMYYDLVAIEAMYGQRATATGATNYVFNDGTRYWQAINDTGGYDTILYNGVEAVSVNLNPGYFSTLSEAISFHRANGTTVTSKGTVTIGPNVLIEAVRSGSGNDTLTGNAGYNSLNGAAGNDNLRGLAGNDTLTGGLGNDTFLFNTALNGLTNRDIVADYNPIQDTILLENAIFSRLPVSAHLSPSYFRAAAHAADSSDFILYNRLTGNLVYDPNGSGAGGEVLVAIFSNKPVLTAYEFTVV